MPRYLYQANELTRRLQGNLPKNFREQLPVYTPADSPVATRKLSQIVLNKLGDALPELIGGSADLTGSNLTRWSTAVDFQHVKAVETIMQRNIIKKLRKILD